MSFDIFHVLLICRDLVDIYSDVTCYALLHSVYSVNWIGLYNFNLCNSVHLCSVKFLWYIKKCTNIFNVIHLKYNNLTGIYQFNILAINNIIFFIAFFAQEEIEIITHALYKTAY